MNKKDSLDKQMLIRLTNDEYWQIKTACKHASMKQYDYLRHKLLSTSNLSFLDQREIHNVRLLGFMLTKIFEQLKDTQIIDHDVREINQLITEIKMIVRRLNDELDKS